MRKSLLLCSLMSAGVILTGCGGGDSGNTANRIVAGYVYVQLNNWPNPGSSPTVIISPSSTAPDGYAAPDDGNVTISVVDGTITRDADSEVFDMEDGNAVVARVVSRSDSTPTMEASFSGLELDGEAKTDLSNPSFDITGDDNTVYSITYGSPSYTPGAPASMRVLVQDQSNTYGDDEEFRFAAPGDVIGDDNPGDDGLIPSANVGDRYNVAVLLHDANGVLIPGTTFTMTDSSSDGPTQAAVTESGNQLIVAGGGTQDAPVTLTFTSPQAPDLVVTHDTYYSYGLANRFAVTFSTPADRASINWATTGAAATTVMNFNVNNGRGIGLPGQTVTLRSLDTSGDVFSGNAYPAPAAGTILSATSVVTDGSGNVAGVTFSAPTSAAGNPAFNGLDIKWEPGCLVQVLFDGSPVQGGKNIRVTRTLEQLNIEGTSRLDIGTVSYLVGPTHPMYSRVFKVLGADDVDSQTISEPEMGGPYVWAINPNTATNYGDPDNSSPRSVAASSFAGVPTGPTAQLNAGSNPGVATVTASFNGTLSNEVDCHIWGPPSKILVDPTPGVGGLSGTAGSSQAVNISFLDGFGHNVTSESTMTDKSGFITSSSGGSLTFPNAPSPLYNLVFPAAEPASITMSVELNWQGNGLGTSTASATGLNIGRTVNLNLP
ncbi:MAG: hypothetical protein JNK63_09335 [Chthonomonas sp.]|nr:hypothetical protein [Chthonomonas sp.]